jgi:hypothetical protein
VFDEDKQTLLESPECSIVAHGPLVLVCKCENQALELGVRMVSTFALLASTIIGTLVAVRAAPGPILLLPIIWTSGVLAALAFTRKKRQQHGRFRVDFDRGEIQHEGRGFTRTYPIQTLLSASTPVVGEPFGEDAEEDALASRWLVLHLKGGRELRLGKGPGYALRPAVAFLRKAGVEVEVRPKSSGR